MHGVTARILALPDEDAEELEKTRAEWLDARTTDNPLELALIERAFETWQQLGRCLRAQQAGVELRMLEAETVERQRARDAAVELGDRLFRDHNGPHQCYPNRPSHVRPLATSGGNIPADPDQPARVVLRLESTAAGCRWLLGRWKELFQLLESGESWRSPDRFRAIRLLGKQPLDAVIDPEVRKIFLACHVLNPVTKSPFDDILREVGDDPHDPCPVVRPALKQLDLEAHTPKDPTEAVKFIVGLIDRSITRLQGLLADHEAREDQQIATAAARHLFDFDPQAELLRRYETSCDRAFHRALTQLRLFQKDVQSPSCGNREPAEAASPPRALVNYPYDRATWNGPNVRNEPVAASIDRDDLAAEARTDAESAAPNVPELRNEPVAASSDRDDLTEAGIDADSAARNVPELRNEPVAASIGRDGSAGRAVESAPAVVTKMSPDRRGACAPGRLIPFGRKVSLADCVLASSRPARTGKRRP